MWLGVTAVAIERHDQDAGLAQGLAAARDVFPGALLKLFRWQ
jgi:hypothetical protein